jgi:hypothetical protein
MTWRTAVPLSAVLLNAPIASFRLRERKNLTSLLCQGILRPPLLAFGSQGSSMALDRCPPWVVTY